MKNPFKRLSTSLIVALSFAASQASWGMDNNDEKNNQPITVKQEPTWSKDTGPFSKLPRYLGKKILDMTIYQQAFETGKSPGNIEATCKVFHNIIGEDTKTFNQNIKLDEKERSLLQFNTRFAFLEGLKVHYNITNQEQIEVFNKIYNGKLIYKPNPNSDNEKIELLISGLKHPLKGEFDLSQCGGTGEALSINMGYRKGQNSKNGEKIEIWFAPWFLIAKDLDTTASHFKPIMDKWKPEQAPVGIFFTCGRGYNLSWYDYLTTESTDEVSKGNLFQKYERLGWTRTAYARWTDMWVRKKISHYVCELK